VTGVPPYYMDTKGLSYENILERSKGYSARTRELMLDVWLTVNFSSRCLRRHPFAVFDTLLHGAPTYMFIHVLSEWLSIRGVTLTVV
jgi:hypothetical protein